MGSVCIEELNQESGSDNLIEYKPALPFKRLCALVIDVIITNIIAGAGGDEIIDLILRLFIDSILINKFI